jgi:hypothetical protein
MPSKLFTIKAAAAALVAVLSIGGVAVAATGLLPGHGRDVAAEAPSTTNASAAGHGLGSAAAADLGGDSQGLCRAWQAGSADNGRRTDSAAFQELAAAAGGTDNIAAYCADVTAERADANEAGRGSAVGPDATAAARAGLCRAWLAGSADNGRRTDSAAFQELAAAAGGAGAHEQGQGSPPSGSPPSTTVSPPSSGPPPDAGSGGHGQGGPPTTG